MLPLLPGAPIATCSNTFSSKVIYHIRKGCVTRCIPSQASLSTTTAPTHQHVVSAGVQCETELWIRSNDRGALEMPNAVQQQGIGMAKTAPKASAKTAARAAAVAPTEKAVTAAEHHKSSATHSSLKVFEDGVPCGSVESEQHHHQPMQQLHCDATQLVEPQVQLQQQRSSATDYFAAPSSSITQEQVIPNAAREYHKQVARSLQNCDSAQQLSEVIQQHGPQMDVISVTSCFSAAARLALQHSQQQQQFDAGGLQQLTNSQPVNQQQQQQQQQQQHFAGHWDTPRAQHSQQDQQQQLQQQQLPGTTRQADVKQQQPQQQHSISNNEMQAMLQLQLVPLMQRKLRQLDAVGLVVVVRALAVLRFKDEALLADLEQAAVPLVNQLSPRLLSQMVWCFGQLAIRPQQQLMRPLLLHSALQLQQQRWNSQDCAQMLHGLAQLQQRPPQSWLDVYYAQVQQLLLSETQLHPTALCIILHSSAKLGCQLPDKLLQQLLVEAEQVLPLLPAAALGMLSHALLLLKRDPSASWQQRYVEAAWGVMMSSKNGDAWNLPLLAVPLLRWRCFPPKWWMEDFLQACSGQLRHMRAQGLAVLGHSIAGLHMLPPQSWQLQYFSAADSKALASMPAGCSYLIHTIAAWHCLDARSSSSSQSADMPVRPSSPADGSWIVKAADAALTPAATALVGLAGDSTAGQGGQSKVVAAGSSTANDARQQQLQLHQLPREHELQLQQLQADLLNQCIQCFLLHGKSFTAEQLGMFCKGLAQIRAQGNVQLSQQLHEVTSTLLKHRSSKLTAATLTNILLAVAVCCPDAATPQLMQLLWWRLQQLLHTVTPAHAAAIIWAVSCLQDGNSSSRSRRSSSDSISNSTDSTSSSTGSANGRRNSKVGSVSSSRNSSGVQPSELFVQQLFQRVALTAEDASLQQLAVLLLQAREAHWQLDSSTVQFLVVELLRNQSMALKKCFCSSNSRESGSSSAVRKSTDSTARFSSNSSSRSQAEARLFGSANHRLKACLQATAAAAAWADVLGPRSRRAALRLCEMLMGRSQDSRVHSLLAVHMHCLYTGRSSISD